jgi:uncharacterized protein YlxP (DUF503 family)
VPGYVAILLVELHFPDVASLKGKRSHVSSAKAQLQRRFAAAVAEVDHHELWQRCGLSAAFVARSEGEVRALAQRAERWLAAGAWELVRCELVVVSPDEL